MDKGRKETLTNVEIVAYALALLAGAEKTIHSEEVAAKCFALFPSRFSWRLPKYRGKWPDKYIVKTALEDAKKKENGAVVDGTYALDLSKDGWRVTPAGVEWIETHKGRIAKALKQKMPILPRIDAGRFIKKLRVDPVFKSFHKTGSLDEISTYMFTDMLGCAPDAPSDIIGFKFDRLLATAKLAGDSEIVEFLETCQSRFSSLLGTNQQ